VVGVWIGGQRVVAEYGRPREGHASAAAATDWLCAHCQGHNFARRTACYTCQAPRGPDSIPLPGTGSSSSSGEAGAAGPSTVVIVRGLDPRTSEEALHALLDTLAPGLRWVRLIRERGTQASRGFAFAQLSSLEEAAHLIARAAEPPGLVLDGAVLRVSYARPRDDAPSPAAANPHAKQLAAEILQQAQWLQASQYQQQQQQQQQQQPYPGYYWDPTTQQWLPAALPPQPQLQPQLQAQAEANQQAQVPAPMPAQPSPPQASPPQATTVAPAPVATPTTAATAKAGKAKKEKKEAVGSLLESKRAEKAISRWNRKSEELKGEEPQRPADAPEAAPPAGAERERDMTAARLEQTVGTICVLCKRQFASEEALQKHVQLSELHKRNLEAARQRLQEQREDAREARLRDSPPAPAEPDNSFDPERSAAARMLKAMGWREGEGLGRDGQGPTALLEALPRPERAGLGSVPLLPSDSASSSSSSSSATYHLAVLRSYRRKWNEIQSEGADRTAFVRSSDPPAPSTTL
jgi:RNA-binding protein 5/10